MNICLFEDHAHRDLLPLVYLRPVWELRCGMDTLLEKVRRAYPEARVTLFCREHLRAAAAERTGLAAPGGAVSGDCLFINARALVQERLPVTPGDISVRGDAVLYAYLDAGRAAGLTPEFFLSTDPARRLRVLGVRATGGESGPTHTPAKVRGPGAVRAGMIRYPWDLVGELESRIVEDIRLRGGPGELRGSREGAVLLEPSGVHLGEGSRLMPGCTVNAETGPVHIDGGVTVYPGAYIQGPCAVGPGCVIRPGARIAGSVLGPACKVGGEVEGSVIQGFSNKQHDGFLGHSYVGSWCNLGAGTSGSDLKNTYGTVRVPLHGQPVDTGTIFAGLFMGDHVKTGINTSFNTGTLIGVMAGIVGQGFPPKYIPSFAWGGAGGFQVYDLPRALETAGRMMQRRERALTPVERALIETVYRLTAAERASLGIG